MINRKSLISAAVCAALLSSVPGISTAAPLPDGTAMSMDVGANPQGDSSCGTGSCFGMEVAPGFWVWTMIEPGNDGGIIVGKNQLSGGQELGPSSTNTTPGDITAAWFFFGSYGTFYADNTQNVFSDTSNNGENVFDQFTVAWEGYAIPMGNGVVNDYTITLDGSGGGSYNIDYATVVPEGHPSNFGGISFRIFARGSVTMTPPDPGSNPPVVNNVSLSTESGVTANWTPDFTDDAGNTHTCEIISNASNGNASVNFDCSGGTYTSGAGFEGVDSFIYRVTDQDGLSGSASVSATVTIPPPDQTCTDAFPQTEVTVDGGGQAKTINKTMTTTFVGHIMSTNGKNAVRICPDTTIDFATTSSIGSETCLLNGSSSSSSGTMAIGDKLICTNKPDGGDTDRFNVKSGL